MIAAVAIHPNDAARLGDRLGPNWTGWGAGGVLGSGTWRRRNGLDYYRTTDPEGQARQREAFAAHIAWAKQYDKALVIHARDAFDDLLHVLDSEGALQRVQMHCFSGDADIAKACLDRGFYLSFAGQVTFKANEELREALDVTRPTDCWWRPMRRI